MTNPIELQKENDVLKDQLKKLTQTLEKEIRYSRELKKLVLLID